MGDALSVPFIVSCSSFISITFFGRAFADELPLPEVVGKFAEINYFKDQRH